MNINDDSSIETVDSDLGISAGFLWIAETAADRQRAQCAFKAALKHYHEAAQTLESILDATPLEAIDADYLRDKLHTLEVRAKRIEQRWSSP
jgi:hypothetical protein